MSRVSTKRNEDDALIMRSTSSSSGSAGAGGFSRGSTGGPRDLTGNPPPLFSDFKSPATGDLDGSPLISLWIIQRDERLGVQWYESCLRIAP